MKVEVYRNLHKKCWSVRDTKTGRVIKHADEVHLEDVQFVVRPAGRAKVLSEKRKNVHAFAKGIISDCATEERYNPSSVIYNPYKYDSFVYSNSEQPIFNAKKAYLNEKGEVYVY